MFNFNYIQITLPLYVFILMQGYKFAYASILGNSAILRKSHNIRSVVSRVKIKIEHRGASGRGQ